MDVTYAFKLYTADYHDFHKENKVRGAFLMLKIRPSIPSCATIEMVTD